MQLGPREARSLHSTCSPGSPCVDVPQYFTERTPGTYIEKKESSLTWHYRDADPNFGSWQAKDIQIQLEDVLSNLPLEIIQGNRMVEVSQAAWRHGPSDSVTAMIIIDSASAPLTRWLT